MLTNRVADFVAELGVGRPGAMCTAEEVSAHLDTVPDNLALAMLADGSQPMDRTLERVEDVHVAASRVDFKGQPVVVAKSEAKRS